MKNISFWRDGLFGFTNDPEFKNCLSKYFAMGHSYGSSRSANIQLTAYETANDFSQFIKADAALIFPALEISN
jgi:hypothetical protein